jgi:hypothetical protein
MISTPAGNNNESTPLSYHANVNHRLYVDAIDILLSRPHLTAVDFLNTVLKVDTPR